MSDADRQTGEELLSGPEMAREVTTGVAASFADATRFTQARELVRALAVGLTNASLYSTTHPLTEHSLHDLVHAVDSLRTEDPTPITINIHKRTLFVENQVLTEESVTYRRIVDELLARGISAVTFLPTFTARDATSLITILSDSSVTSLDAAHGALEESGASGVKLAETAAIEETDVDSSHDSKTTARRAYDAGIETMRDVETQAKLGKVFDVEPLQNLVSSMLDTLFRDPAAVLGLTAIKGHDDYTLNHSINVCILSLSLGASLGLNAGALRSLGLASLLYDLGKVRIPEEILTKQGPLTADEWRIVKGHTSLGADLLKHIQLVDEMPMIVAYEHHQRHDLQGYPERKASREQHLFSKIVALCDAYDAMTTRRPFRHEIRPDKALAVLMQGRGKAYDPALTKSLVVMLGIYPMGAIVRLDDASLAVVFRVNPDDLLHPRVKILADRDGRWLETPEVLDLRAVDPETGVCVRTIVECVPAADAGVDDVWQYL